MYGRLSPSKTDSNYIPTFKWGSGEAGVGKGKEWGDKAVFNEILARIDMWVHNI